jgi:hypothetical protein
MCGPKREEVTGGWRRLHTEELHNLYSSLDIITMIKTKRMKLAGHIARMGEMVIAYETLFEKNEWKRPL